MGFLRTKKISPSIYRRVVKGRIGLAKPLKGKDLEDFGGENAKIEQRGNVKISFELADLLRNLEKLFLGTLIEKAVSKGG